MEPSSPLQWQSRWMRQRDRTRCHPFWMAGRNWGQRLWLV